MTAFGGKQEHRGRPTYAAYRGDECVAVGTACEVAEAMGVKVKTVWCGVAPSRDGKPKRRAGYYRWYEEDD